MGNKNEELNLLFEEWKNKVSLYQECFVKDGVIDEQAYDSAKIKILFICKEPNDPNKDSWDFREEWGVNENFYYSFAYRIAEWSYGLLKGFPPYDEMWAENDFENMRRSIKQIAFMNIKKSGGGTSVKEELIEHLNENYHFIIKQIRIIDPEIIILGLSWSELSEGIFGETNWSKTGYSKLVKKHGNAKVIEFYHPSSRMPGVASYSLLQNIIQSEVYEEL